MLLLGDSCFTRPFPWLLENITLFEQLEFILYSVTRFLRFLLLTFKSTSVSTINRRTMSETTKPTRTAREETPVETSKQAHTATISRDRNGDVLGAAIFVDGRQLTEAGIDPSEASLISYSASEQGLELSAIQR